METARPPFNIKLFIKFVFIFLLIGSLILAVILSVPSAFPSPIKEFAISLHDQLLPKTSGKLTSSWEAVNCEYTKPGDKETMPSIRGNCSLELLDGTSGLRGTLSFIATEIDYSGIPVTSADANAKIDLSSYNYAIRLQDAKVDDNKITIKSYLRDGTIYEFVFTIDGDKLTFNNISYISEAENTVHFDKHTMIFDRKKDWSWL